MANITAVKANNRYNQMLNQFIAGGSAGLIEICLMHPMDLVKTRFQLQSSYQNSVYYRSLAHCFTTMHRTEGLLSFYKGILPPILAETPKRAVKFFCFEQYSELFSKGKKKTPLIYSWAGFCSGVTNTFIINPFERVKILLQAEWNINFMQQQTTYSKAREIIKSDGFGFMGLNKGLTATLGRNGIWNMVYFGMYHSAKDCIPKSESQTVKSVYTLTIGFMAGAMASVVNLPYDVAKSRIQGPQPVPGEIKYYGAHNTIITIYKEEGFLALYRGMIPKLIRLGPGGAIMMFAYETIAEYLRKRFPN